MKPKRNLVEQINIKDSARSKSLRSPDLKINLSNNNSFIKRTQSKLSRVKDPVQNAQQPSQQPSQLKFSQITQKHVTPSQINPAPLNTNSQQKISENSEQSKIHELNNNLSSLSVSVSNIKNQYSELKQSETKILQSTKKSRTKKIGKLDHPHIVNFLFKKQIQQDERERKRLDEVQRLEKLKKLKQQKQEKQRQEAKLAKINQIKKSMFVKEKNQAKKSEQVIKQKQAQQIFSKYRNSIPLFQIKQKQTLQEQIKRTQEIKEYLKNHRQSIKSITDGIQPSVLDQHKKNHLEKLEKLDKQKNQHKIQVLKKIQEENQSLKHLFRGKVSEKVAAQFKEIEQKRQIPHRIRQRIKGYQDYVKQNYKPKMSLSKIKSQRSNTSSLDLKTKRQNNSTLSFRQIKRYKYLHGVSFGQIVEQRPMAKSYEEERRAGKGNLQFVKSLPKKKVMDNSNSMEIPIKKSPRPNPLLHNRRKKPVISLNDEPTRDQIRMVLQQLRLNDKKIKQKEKMIYFKGPHHEATGNDRSQVTDEFLLNIEKKMNLLHKLQDNNIKLNSQQRTEQDNY